MLPLADGVTCGQDCLPNLGGALSAKLKTQALCSKSLKDFKAGTAEQESGHGALLQAGHCTTAGVTGPGSQACQWGMEGSSSLAPWRGRGPATVAPAVALRATASPRSCSWDHDRRALPLSVATGSSIKDRLFSTSLCPVFISCHAYST